MTRRTLRKPTPVRTTLKNHDALAVSQPWTVRKSRKSRAKVGRPLTQRELRINFRATKLVTRDGKVEWLRTFEGDAGHVPPVRWLTLSRRPAAKQKRRSEVSVTRGRVATFSLGSHASAPVDGHIRALSTNRKTTRGACWHHGSTRQARWTEQFRQSAVVSANHCFISS